MITAEEAKIETDTNIEKSINAQLNKIETSIETAIDEGKYITSFSERLLDETEKKLESLGYKVSVSDTQQGGYFANITWR